MKADRKYLAVLVLALFGVLAITGAHRGASPSSSGVLLAAPHEDDQEEAEDPEGEEGEGPELRVIGLEHQPAPAAMETLQQLFKSDLFDEVRGKLAVAPNGPANAIVVVGPERAVDLIEGMLRELDELAAQHGDRMRDREAEHRERMQHENAERREPLEREEAERREPLERGRDEDRRHREFPEDEESRRERAEDLRRQSEKLRDEIERMYPVTPPRRLRPRGDLPELPQKDLQRYMPQMRQMREQMEHFFREYGRPRGDDRPGPRVFEGPSFRFEFRPEIDRPKVKRL